MDFQLGMAGPVAQPSNGTAATGGMPNTTPEPVAYAHDELTGVPQSDVGERQQYYVRYGSMPDEFGAIAGLPPPLNAVAQSGPQVPIAATQGAREWRQAESAKYAMHSGMGYAGSTPVSLKSHLPISVSMSLTRAPAAYAYPIVQRKPFKPPFTLRMQVQYQRTLNMVLTVDAHVMNDLQHNKPQHWNPDIAAADKNSELDNARIQRHLKAGTPQSQQDDNPSATSTIVEDFEFSDLKYVKSSRMNKRWLVFSCKIETDLIYIMYVLPTVIISRRTDQYEKAYETLMGHPPAMLKKNRVNRNPEQPERQRPTWREDGGEDEVAAPVRVTASLARQFYMEKYAQSGFTRQLDDQDIQHLLDRAGLSPDLDLSVESSEWVTHREWFSKTLRALYEVRDVWNHDHPVLICGFAIGREEADNLLRPQQAGAFLIRVCSEPGSFAISCKVDSIQATPFVDHLLVDTVDLHKHPLEKFVWQHQAARLLLEVSTGRLYSKEEIFGPSIRQMEAAAQEANFFLPSLSSLPGLGHNQSLPSLQQIAQAVNTPVSLPTLLQGAGPPRNNSRQLAPDSLFSLYNGGLFPPQPSSPSPVPDIQFQDYMAMSNMRAANNNNNYPPPSSSRPFI